MDVNNKLANAIDNSINNVGVNVRFAKYPRDVFCLSEDKVEVSMKPNDYEYIVFLYAFSEMLKNGEATIVFSDSDSTKKHKEYLSRLIVEEHEFKEQ